MKLSRWSPSMTFPCPFLPACQLYYSERPAFANLDACNFFFSCQIPEQLPALSAIRHVEWNMNVLKHEGEAVGFVEKHSFQFGMLCRADNAKRKHKGKGPQGKGKACIEKPGESTAEQEQHKLTAKQRKKAEKDVRAIHQNFDGFSYSITCLLS